MHATLKPTQLIAACKDLAQMGMSTYIDGPPGTGKTSLMAQLSAELGVKHYAMRAGDLDLGDFALPHVVGQNGNARTHWALSSEFPAHDAGPCTLFVDEMPTAAPAIQAMFYRVFLEREIRGHKLPEKCWTVGAGNRAVDRGIHFQMPMPLKDRVVHLTLLPDIQDTCTWMVQNGIRPEIIAFLRLRPDLLIHPGFLPTATPEELKELRTMRRPYTPRSWEYLSRIVDRNPPADLELPLYQGTVSDGQAAEFLGFMRIYRDAPSVDVILMDPKRAPVPTEPSALYAVSAALGHRATDSNIGRIVQYLDRLPQEYSVLTIRDATIRDKAIYSTEPVVKWAVKFHEVITI